MNGHIYHHFEHFESFSFFFFFISLFYLKVPKNASESTYFSNSSEGACSKTTLPGQCAFGKILDAWCSYRDLFAPKFKILGAKSTPV